MNINKELAVASALCSALIAGATQAAVPNTFGAGQPARAAEVNDNFTDLDGRVTTLEDNATVINLADYLPAAGLTKKVYSRERYQGSNPRQKSVCDRWTLDFTNRAEMIFTLSRSDNSQPCFKEHIFATPVAGGYAETGYDDYNHDGTNFYLDLRVVHRAPEELFGTVLLGQHKSKTYVSDVADYDPTGTLLGSSMETTLLDFVVIGIEDVTVPAGTYQNCLKISRSYLITTGGSNQAHQWRCPGVGDVKQVRVYQDNRSEVRELLSIE